MKKYILIILFILFIIYKDEINIINNYSNTILVNKNNKLKKEYVPTNLVKIKDDYSTKEIYLKKEAANSFYKLSNKAKKKNLNIKIVSGYRSYDYQENLFNYYVKEKGIEYALLCSAMAGHSEHQTGLAIDVEGSNKDYNLFEQSKEFNWMKNNSYKYGFILRYPKDKIEITGFKYEPWHYRYVGKKLSKYLYKKNLTLEEYYNLKKN